MSTHYNINKTHARSVVLNICFRGEDFHVLLRCPNFNATVQGCSMRKCSGHPTKLGGTAKLHPEILGTILSESCS